MKIGRNSLCPCGSGKKFKKCCMASTVEVGSHSPVLPSHISCNECGHSIYQDSFQVMDTTGMRGVDIVFAGLCQSCNHETWAASGDPDAVNAVMSAIQKEQGEGTFGFETVKV